jgi:hypothetical protein
MAISFGCLAFLVAISVSLATTSAASYEAILFIRRISLVAAAFAIAYRILNHSVSKVQVLAIGVYFVSLVWAFSMAQLNDVVYLDAENIVVDAMLVTLGILLVPTKTGTAISPDVAIAYASYSLVILLVTIVTSGLFIEVPPRFSFEYGSEQFGSEVLYGQGPSFFFGLSSIVCAYLWKTTRTGFLKALSMVLAITFLCLSFLGGARGDSLIAGAILLPIFFSAAPKYITTIVLLVALLALNSSFDFSWVYELTFVLRMLGVADGDYGTRDILFAQAIDLLIRDPWCAMVGCGPGYFQAAYGYEFGLYPHNIFLECLLIFGIPMTAASILIAANGVKIYWRKSGRSVDLFLLMFAYYTVVAMKSGYFFGSWFTLVGFSYFFAINFEDNSRSQN